ncbi:hypothetical protein [Herbaspirillum sp. RV1423]|uniref:hypothetical protein n=1 Tax=Herbaspirillum sp. RV1423 TaxID=1443993 RepID=UPI0004B8FCAE|nr:hypothetical protein [Herbaspirillum sp. RV1423]
MKDVHDRFWVPEANLRAAEKSARKNAKRKFHGAVAVFNSYVPTRKEITSLPLVEVRKILVEWMLHSVTEIIPSRAQISEVKSILLSRSDITGDSELVVMCDCYLRNDN